MNETPGCDVFVTIVENGTYMTEWCYHEKGHDCPHEFICGIHDGIEIQLEK